MIAGICDLVWFIWFCNSINLDIRSRISRKISLSNPDDVIIMFFSNVFTEALPAIQSLCVSQDDGVTSTVSRYKNNISWEGIVLGSVWLFLLYIKGLSSEEVIEIVNNKGFSTNGVFFFCFQSCQFCRVIEMDMKAVESWLWRVHIRVWQHVYAFEFSYATWHSEN